MIKAALQYISELVKESEKTEVLEIAGKTYANKDLRRYGKADYASALQASTLTALLDYIGSSAAEFREDMLIHIVSPTMVRLISRLDEERSREILFETNAEVSEFQFDKWYDQERFMIEMQANFEDSEDRALILKMAGNVERKNDQSFTDNGTDQTATMHVGIASKADVIVPNPVRLIPYRTFQEVDQPASSFVFRLGDKEVPAFKIIEAEGGIWKNEAVRNIKEYLAAHIAEMPEGIQRRITIIG